jgi:hypothetical protein
MRKNKKGLLLAMVKSLVVEHPEPEEVKKMKKEKTKRVLTRAKVKEMKDHLKKAFAQTWSLHLIAHGGFLHELNEEEAEILLDEASWNIDQALILLNGENLELLEPDHSGPRTKKTA